MAKKQRKNLARLNLRTVFATLALLSIFLGIWTSRSITQRNAVEAIKDLGGEVLYSNEDSGRLPETIASWLGQDFVFSVYSVNLQDTDITDKDLRLLTDIPSIEGLYLSGTNVVGTGFDKLLQLKNLKSIGFGAKITNESLRHVGKLRSLTHLSFGHAKQIDDDGLLYLSDLTNLERVNLWHTGMSNEGLETISALPRIRAIIAGGTKITDSGTRCLRKNQTLEVLVLQNTIIGDETLKNLSKISTLKELVVTGTNITDDGLASLNDCQHLKKLSRSTNFTTSTGRASLQLRLPTTAIH